MVVKLNSGPVESLSEQLDASLGRSSDPNAQTEVFHVTAKRDDEQEPPAPPSWKPKNGKQHPQQPARKPVETDPVADIPLPGSQGDAIRHMRENDYARVNVPVTPMSVGLAGGILLLAGALGSLIGGFLSAGPVFLTFVCIAVVGLVLLVAGGLGYPMLFVRRAVEDEYDVRVVTVDRIPDDSSSTVRPGDLSYAASKLADGGILMRYVLPADPSIRSFTVRAGLFSATVMDPYRGRLIGRTEVSDGRYTGI